MSVTTSAEAPIQQTVTAAGDDPKNTAFTFDMSTLKQITQI